MIRKLPHSDLSTRYEPNEIATRLPTQGTMSQAMHNTAADYAIRFQLNKSYISNRGDIGVT
jgi:hypothetical protein